MLLSPKSERHGRPGMFKRDFGTKDTSYIVAVLFPSREEISREVMSSTGMFSALSFIVPLLRMSDFPYRFSLHAMSSRSNVLWLQLSSKAYVRVGFPFGGWMMTRTTRRKTSLVERSSETVARRSCGSKCGASLHNLVHDRWL